MLLTDGWVSVCSSGQFLGRHEEALKKLYQCLDRYRKAWKMHATPRPSGRAGRAQPWGICPAYTSHRNCNLFRLVTSPVVLPGPFYL